VVLATSHTLRAHEALGCPDALPDLIEDGLFVGHDKSIQTGSLRSLDCFAFSCEHEDIVAGVAAGKHRVEVEDFDFSYGVYADGVRVACFAEGRIGYREWARRNGMLGDIHNIDDRLNHDIGELMA
jgi:hypothetical protein